MTEPNEYARSTAGASTTTGSAQTLESVIQPFVFELKSLAGEGEYCIACAPSRLDVMGGLSESFGSLTLQTPIGEPVIVAASTRADGLLVVSGASAIKSNGASNISIPIASIYSHLQTVIDASRAKVSLLGGRDTVTRTVVGIVAELFRAANAEVPTKGLSISLLVEPSAIDGSGKPIAIAAASVLAVARALGIAINEKLACTVCRRALIDWAGLTVGAADVACTLLGEAGSLAQRQGDSADFIGHVSLPAGLTIVGIDSGVTVDNSAQKLERVRTASLMGNLLVDRITQHEGAKSSSRIPSLATYSIRDFVERFRDRLPTKIKGSDFLDRIGHEAELATRIEPATVYKVRSRTEHHIYEHSRARQLAECLARAARTNDEKTFADAGEILYSSHWSFGQRCGLGSVQTDLLVTLLRGAGTDNGIFGAKITGCGCGGVLALLMRADDRASAALNGVLGEYEKRTGLKAYSLPNGHNGAMNAGVRVM